MAGQTSCPADRGVTALEVQRKRIPGTHQQILHVCVSVTQRYCPSSASHGPPHPALSTARLQHRRLRDATAPSQRPRTRKRSRQLPSEKWVGLTSPLCSALGTGGESCRGGIAEAQDLAVITMTQFVCVAALSPRAELSQVCGSLQKAQTSPPPVLGLTLLNSAQV